mmetsp:Transcript_20866/g.31467  ORF Transcript_20866/g.31467 Transcript_20866/m.31467 type:complete len:127 (+) Transcript_20866:1126-1506(+)
MSFMPAVSSNYYFLVSVPIFCFGRSMDCETILYQSNLPHEKSNSRGNHYFFRCQWCSSPKERTASYPGPSVGLTFLFVFFFYSRLRSYGSGINMIRKFIGVGLGSFDFDGKKNLCDKSEGKRTLLY